MQENEKRIEETVVDNTDYITALKELKQNSVSKEQYDALEAEKKRLLDAFVNGQEDENQDNGEVLEARQVYLDKYLQNEKVFKNNNLEYWDNFLKLRKATIAEYGKDPTVTGNYGLTPDGEHVEPAYGEAEAMEKQFEIIEQMVEEADGDPTLFDALMSSALRK